MARIKSTNFYQKSGKVANEVFSNLGNGVVGCRAQNSKQAPLNAEQKINASGFGPQRRSALPEPGAPRDLSP